ncbi:hypothetical protein RBH29_12830 [Herbivorax sp. ANBcel31]|uniref:hypothetical protein n=1 Tax=Herbivorax sp. ANBcel31 TaxID=3069754 RepID=UPI0027B39910|nr:hypothetical protein [Herbivorax sp. ANBcel31]MDQ2087310.1 hypothetical protein [Herbivorax sp. ANBcel31]
MFSTKTSLLSIVKKQYFNKLNQYSNIVFALVAIQIFTLAISFTLYGTSIRRFNPFFVIDIRSYADEIAIVFTMIFVLIASAILRSKTYRDMDFNFISNRLSSQLSTIGFLLTIVVAGSTFAVLSGYMLRVLRYFLPISKPFSIIMSHISFQDFLLSVSIITLYLLLFSALGYFIGSLIYFNKIFAVLLTVLFLTIIFFRIDYTVFVHNFYFHETSILVFTLKTLIPSIVLFLLSIMLTKEKEVRL